MKSNSQLPTYFLFVYYAPLICLSGLAYSSLQASHLEQSRRFDFFNLSQYFGYIRSISFWMIRKRLI